MYGIISFGSVTNEHILPTIWAAFFLVSAPLSLSPLCTIGTKSASEGASIELTNVVWKIHMQNQQKRYSKKTNKQTNNLYYLLLREYQENILYSHLDL